ncbi:MAG: GNAT family N-acetyltransferase [Pseudomonadota bacterium]
MVELVLVSPEQDRPRIEAWLAKPHVTRWWGDPSDRLAQFDATPRDNHAFIATNGEAVGYIRWETVDLEALQSVGLDEVPEGSVDCDLFIGEEGLTGQGIGPCAIELLADRLKQLTAAPLVGFCSSVENEPAHVALGRSGCTLLTTYDDPTFGPCHVFVRWLR